MTQKQLHLANEQDTIDIGRRLASVLSAPTVLFLNGELGAGKTTLTRGLIQAMGHKGAVKSPTYTLVEPYKLGDTDIYHFDLYRLADPEELEFMGIRDYFNDNSIAIIEWPEQGYGLLPPADLSLHLSYQAQARTLVIEALTPKGLTVLAKLN